MGPSEAGDLGLPAPAATDAEGRRYVAENGILILSLSGRTVGVVTSTGGRWWLELGEHRVQAYDQQLVEVCGHRFRLSLPPPDGDPGRLGLELTTRANGDEVACSVLIVGARRHELRVRRHTHLLLELAEARRMDARSNLSDAEQGWVDAHVLRRRLGLTPQQLYVHTFRARAQLEAAAPSAQDVLQVRGERTRRQLRLGVQQVSVIAAS